VVGFVGDRLNAFLFRKGSMLQGGNYVVRREALDLINGYDTSIDFYGEDTDVGRRLHEVGLESCSSPAPSSTCCSGCSTSG
jgi:GT2 family glycosyltransferase